MSQTRGEPTSIRYGGTDRLRAAHRSHVVAQAHLEAGASLQVCDAILFRGADPSVSSTRRRVVTWAVREGYLRPVKSEPVKVASSLDEIESFLAKVPK